MEQLLDKYKSQNFDVITINIQDHQDKGAIQIMSNYSFTSLKGLGDSLDWAGKTYGVDGTPTSFLLDPEGKAIFKLNGLESVSELETAEEEVDGLLAYTKLRTAATASATTKSQR